MRLSIKALEILADHLPNWSRRLLDYLYPPRCGVCDTFWEQPICPSCREGWEFVEPPYCLWCGQPFPKVPQPSPLCGQCLRGRFRFDGARPAVRYSGVGRQTIHSLKFRRKARLAIPMGQVMADLLVRMLQKDNGLLPEPWQTPEIIVPVPLHPKVYRLRGFNQAEHLAREVAKGSCAAIETDIVVQARLTRSQATLSASERWDNVRGAFAVTRPELVKGKTILVIDDVMTTGATVNEIARVLKEAGAQRVYVIAFARGQV
ncbi:MAG: ComF family protein [Armatimonadetes bacterium]|nr:ComF family protein [Armatimonadota bacterium]MDW8121582.1 ComF family protein [Armatimonadota bacterium]